MRRISTGDCMARRIAVASFIAALLFIGGCGRGAEPVPVSDGYAQPTEIVLNDGTAPGYTGEDCASWAETETARYCFSGDYKDEEEQRLLIRKAELTLRTAMHEYGMKPMLPSAQINVFFGRETVRYTDGMKTSRVDLNLDDSAQTGVLTYFISSGRLPAWLCTGLELYWQSEAELTDVDAEREIDAAAWYADVRGRGLPALGDEWFVPGLIADEGAKDARALSYQLTRHLAENGQLQQLLEAYLRVDAATESDSSFTAAPEAEALRLHAWEELTGQVPVTEEPRAFRYWMNHYRYNPRHADLLFGVFGSRDRFIFTNADWWRYETALSVLSADEYSIQYVEDWFDFRFEKPLTLYHMADMTDGKLSGQQCFLATNVVWIEVSEHSHALSSAHEITHLALHALDIETQGYVGDPGDQSQAFEEGLCTLIDYSCVQQTSIREVAATTGAFNKWIMQKLLSESLYQKYLSALKSENYPDKEIVFADFAALYKLEQRSLAENAEKTGDYAQYVMDPDISTSFLFYLLQQGDKDDLLRVYQNSGLMESVYGKDQATLISEWLERLAASYGV